MMFRYMLAYYLSQKFKVTALVISLAIYFAALLIAFSLLKAIPAIAELPLKSIGVQTIVQKNGQIPEQMYGVVFPHANAPISAPERKQLDALDFALESEAVVFFWYFDDVNFKSASGIDNNSNIASLVASELGKTQLALEPGEVVITQSLSDRQGLKKGQQFEMSGQSFVIREILPRHPSGNIIASDIYMLKSNAMELVRGSDQLARLYPGVESMVGNVLLIKTDPAIQGDKSALAVEIHPDLLVFSERTFTDDIQRQLALVSGTGRVLLGAVGGLLVLAFGLMVIYNLKTREQEIMTLRKVGWRLADLRRQFIGESFFVLLSSIILGNGLALVGLLWLQQQQVNIPLPWDITAKPHFLVQENAIDRVVEAQLPVSYEPLIALASSALLMVGFLALSWVLFSQLKRIKPVSMAGTVG